MSLYIFLINKLIFEGLPIYINQLDKAVDLVFYYLKNWEVKENFNTLNIKIEIPMRSIDDSINEKMKVALEAINVGLMNKWKKNKEKDPDLAKPNLLHHIKHKTITIILSRSSLINIGFNLSKQKYTSQLKLIEIRQKLKAFIKFQWDQQIEQLNNISEPIVDITARRPKNQFEDIPDYEWDLEAIYGKVFVTDEVYYEFDTMHLFLLNTPENSVSEGWLT